MSSSPGTSIDQAFAYFSSLADGSLSDGERTGRPTTPDEMAVWNDMTAKLRIEPGLRIVDIGCGCGFVARRWFELLSQMEAQLTLFDFPKVLELVRKELGHLDPSNRIRLVPGKFPDDIGALKRESYDRVGFYGVLLYFENPTVIVDQLVSLLAPGGRLLVGDIPNLNKKGRFLASPKGRAFDAAYKGVPLDEVPFYRNHHEFVDSMPDEGGERLDDDFMLKVAAKYRDLGYHAFILEQPHNLPFSYTREDLLICHPDTLWNDGGVGSRR